MFDLYPPAATFADMSRSSSTVHAPLPQLFPLAVDVIQSLSEVDPRSEVRLQPRLRLDKSLDNFLRVLNPQGMSCWDVDKRKGYLGSILVANNLDQDAKYVLTAMVDCVTDLNGAMDQYRRWWDWNTSADPSLEEVLTWIYLTQRWWLAVGGLWAIMGEDQRQLIPQGSKSRMLAVTGWKELPDIVPPDLYRRGNRMVDLDRWKTRRMSPEMVLIAQAGEEEYVPNELHKNVVPKTDIPPIWSELEEAKRQILTELNKSTDRLQGKGVARKTGYTAGTLRHHYRELQDWKYIDKAKDGYAITQAGAALVPCESV